MTEPYQRHSDAIRQRILAGGTREGRAVVPAANAVEHAEAGTPLTGPAHGVGPTAQDRVPQSPPPFAGERLVRPPTDTAGGERRRPPST